MAAVLVDHAADGAAVYHARGALPRHRELQDGRHGQPADRGWAGLDHGSRLDHAQARGVRELADRLFLGLRNHSVRDGVRPRQHLREGAEPGEKPMSLANAAHSVVEPSAGTRRFAGALAPDAGIHPDVGSAAWALRQHRAQPQHGHRRTVELCAAFRQFADHRLRFDGARRRPRHVVGLWIFAVPCAPEGRPAVLHSVDQDDAADRGRDPDLLNVPHRRTVGYPARDDPALHLGQRLARRLAPQGLHRRDPARVRGGGDDRRLYALSGFREGGATAGDDRNRGDGDLLPDFRVERIRLCGASDLRQRADGAALHSDHHRRGWAGLAGGGRRYDVLPGANRRVHGAVAQASATRHHLWSRPQMSLDANTSTLRRSFADRILRRGPLEAIATTIIAMGVVMLMQPFFLTLYSWSFATTLFGTVMFIIVSRVRE